MTLDDYLHTNRIRQHDFAALCGLTAPSISRIARGQQTPDAASIRAIVAASGGAVTANDLLGIVPAETGETQL